MCGPHGTFRCCAPFHEIPRRSNKRLFKKEKKNSLWGTDFVSVCVWMYMRSSVAVAGRMIFYVIARAEWFGFFFFSLPLLSCLHFISDFVWWWNRRWWFGLTTHEPPQPPIAYVKLPKSIKTERKEEKKKKKKHHFGFNQFFLPLWNESATTTPSLVVQHKEVA